MGKTDFSYESRRINSALTLVRQYWVVCQDAGNFAAEY